MPYKNAFQVLERASLALYVMVGCAIMVQGVRYLGANALMPYHLAVLGLPWDGIPQAQAGLFLGLLRGFGAGAFCVGLTTVYLALGPTRQGLPGARLATPLLAGTYTLLLVWITSTALLDGAKPVAISVSLLVMVIAGSACSFLCRRKPAAL